MTVAVTVIGRNKTKLKTNKPHFCSSSTSLHFLLRDLRAVVKRAGTGMGAHGHRGSTPRFLSPQRCPPHVPLRANGRTDKDVKVSKTWHP